MPHYGDGKDGFATLTRLWYRIRHTPRQTAERGPAYAGSRALQMLHSRHETAKCLSSTAQMPSCWDGRSQQRRWLLISLEHMAPVADTT